MLQLLPSAWILSRFNSKPLSELHLFRQTIKHHICPENWAVIHKGSLLNPILFHYAALVAGRITSPSARMLMLYLPSKTLLSGIKHFLFYFLSSPDSWQKTVIIWHQCYTSNTSVWFFSIPESSVVISKLFTSTVINDSFTVLYDVLSRICLLFFINVYSAFVLSLM